MAKAPVFDQTYRQYVDKLAALDLHAMAPLLGLEARDDGAAVRLIDTTYRIDGHGITDSNGRVPDLGVSVVIASYLLRCPKVPPTDGPLCAFKDFRDAAPLVNFFTNNAEKAVAARFGGQPAQLTEKCLNLGGVPYDADLSYDVKFTFSALPRIPAYLLFNDADDGFPADCRILFNKSAETYLDMESLSVLGVILVHGLLH